MRPGPLGEGLAKLSDRPYVRLAPGCTRARVAPSTRGFVPITIAEIELAAPMEALASMAGAEADSRARVLVRLHREPLGFVDIPLPASGQPADELSSLIWTSVREPASEHLRRDGLDVPASLGPDALPWPSGLPCESWATDALPASPRVTVVVATCDRVDSLARCLESLTRLQYPNFEVLVVNNGREESDTRGLVREFEARLEIAYLREPVRGLAAAHNTGIEHATGELIAFTDDDVVVDRWWLFEVVRAFGGHGNVGCVTGLILPDQLGTETQVWFEDALGVNKGFDRVDFNAVARKGDPLFPYAAGAFGSGANMAFRATTLNRIQGFDPATGAGTISRGGDDLGAFFDVIELGETIAYQPSAIVWHRHWVSSDGLSSRMFGYGSGLGAYLAKTVLDQPLRLIDIALRVPAGLRHLLGREQVQRQLNVFDFSRRLAWSHRAGMAYGVFAYAVERRRRRNIARPGRNS